MSDEYVKVEDQVRKALIDTGCSLSLIAIDRIADKERIKYSSVNMLTLNSDLTRTLGTICVSSLSVNGVEYGPTIFHVVKSLPAGFEVILGYDFLSKYGLSILPNDECKSILNQALLSGTLMNPIDDSSDSNCDVCIKIEDKDFSAKFDGEDWVVSWHWKNGVPQVLPKRPNYKIKEKEKDAFDKEINTWISDGILVPWDQNMHGEVKNFVPLMSVFQMKGEISKVRPVLDFRSLNEHLASYPADATPLCQEKLRDWRKKGSQCAVVDLRRAYLQIKMEKSLWCYQAVRFEGKIFLLTRLGFGLNIAPKVMTAIVETVLKANQTIARNTSSYIDDIFVAESGGVTVQDVVEHLKKFGLQTKAPEHFGDEGGVRVLGLRVDETMRWSRDGSTPVVNKEGMTRRQVHSLLGKLTSHLPVTGWLRASCSFIQRCTAKDGVGWDEQVSPETMSKLIDLNERLLATGDPAKGSWPVNPGGQVKVWTDASNIAYGVAIDVDGNIVEDATWLKKSDDTTHINVSELDAVLKGINLALKWGFKSFTIMVDSSTVLGWLKSVLFKTHNVKIHAISELLIRRRLNILRELVVQEDLSLDIQKVPTSKNKADELTRVPKSWLMPMQKKVLPQEKKSDIAGVMIGRDMDKSSMFDNIKKIHEQNHFGVKRTYDLALEKYGAAVSKKMVKKVIKICTQCKRFCPSNEHLTKPGSLASNKVWELLSCDVTHFHGETYLTLIDHASNFMIWKKLRTETADEICFNLQQIFSEMGPPERLLTDNGPAFLSAKVKMLLIEWKVNHELSCAYRPKGNGKIERSHRTIKTIASRTNCNIAEAIFWYNVTSGTSKISPYELVFGAKARIPDIRPKRIEICRPKRMSTGVTEVRDPSRNPFVVGEKVYLKTSSRCDVPWTGPHRVTSINSDVSVELDGDGVARHISHIRRVLSKNGNDGFDDDDEDDEDDEDDDIDDEVDDCNDNDIDDEVDDCNDNGIEDDEDDCNDNDIGNDNDDTVDDDRVNDDDHINTESDQIIEDTANGRFEPDNPTDGKDNCDSNADVTDKTEPRKCDTTLRTRSDRKVCRPTYLRDYVTDF